MSLAEAWYGNLTKKNIKSVEWEELREGKETFISASFVSIYPPGIPLVCPGEVITEEIVEEVIRAKKTGLKVTGLYDGTECLIVHRQ